jgi:hypothetical protein
MRFGIPDWVEIIALTIGVGLLLYAIVYAIELVLYVWGHR